MYIDFDKYQGLIFDMDGTLIDTMPAHLKAWEQTAEQFRFPFSQEWLHSLGGMPSVKIVVEINKMHGTNLDAPTVASFKMNTFASIEDHGDVIHCSLNVLKRYHGIKKIAVGTGSQRDSAIKLLNKSQILPLLDTLVSATDVTNHKPNPDTFLLAAQNLGLAPSDCVVFEDTELGRQAAHAAGMDCVLVEEGRLRFCPLNSITV